MDDFVDDQTLYNQGTFRVPPQYTRDGHRRPGDDTKPLPGDESLAKFEETLETDLDKQRFRALIHRLREKDPRFWRAGPHGGHWHFALVDGSFTSDQFREHAGYTEEEWAGVRDSTYLHDPQRPELGRMPIFGFGDGRTRHLLGALPEDTPGLLTNFRARHDQLVDYWFWAGSDVVCYAYNTDTALTTSCHNVVRDDVTYKIEQHVVILPGRVGVKQHSCCVNPLGLVLELGCFPAHLKTQIQQPQAAAASAAQQQQQPQAAAASAAQQQQQPQAAAGAGAQQQQQPQAAVGAGAQQQQQEPQAAAGAGAQQQQEEADDEMLKPWVSAHGVFTRGNAWNTLPAVELVVGGRVTGMV